MTIPKSVISVHTGDFLANEIEKVVFEGVIDINGKEHENDDKPYYLAALEVLRSKAIRSRKLCSRTV